MTTFIDRRNNKGKSSENRQRFLKRIKFIIKQALPELINKRTLKDMASTGDKVNISRKSMEEPTFRYMSSGKRNSVYPGNQEWVVGDKIQKPKGGQGQGNGKAGGSGEKQEDDFVVEISREEFLNYFFEDLELPDLAQSDMNIDEPEYSNAGWTTEGNPSKLSLIKSMRNSHARRLSLKSPLTKKLKIKEEELKNCKDPDLIEALKKEIEALKRKIKAVPFLDSMDLRYHSTKVEYKPSTSAEIYFIADVSGSMGQWEKMITRKFFYLFYMFLNKQYKKITLRFIIHTTEAREVDEDEFFNTRESGGTRIASALELAHKLINESKEKNIYVAQVSDGDDSEPGTAREILEDDILPNNKIKYFAFIQLDNHKYYQNSYEEDDSNIIRAYSMAARNNPKLNIKTITDESEIYSVFKELFNKK